MQNNSNSANDLKGHIDEIKGDLSSYIEKRLELIKLTSYEKIAQSGSFIAYSLIVLLLIFNILFLSLLGLAYFIGDYLNSAAAGFGILMVVAAIILLIFIFRGKQFRRYIVNTIISIMRKVEANED